MSTPDVALLRPGTKIGVTDSLTGAGHTATVLQQFNGCLYYLPDDVETVEWVACERVRKGEIGIRVLDTSAVLEVEVIDGPPGGMTVEDRVGVEITDLSHEDPAQSGPPTTHVAHPVGGYDPPSVEPREVIHALLRLAYFVGRVVITIEGTHAQETVVRVGDEEFRGSWEGQIAPAIVEFDRKRGQ